MLMSGMLAYRGTVGAPVDPLALSLSPVVSVSDVIEDELSGDDRAARVFKVRRYRARLKVEGGGIPCKGEGV